LQSQKRKRNDNNISRHCLFDYLQPVDNIGHSGNSFCKQGKENREVEKGEKAQTNQPYFMKPCKLCRRKTINIFNVEFKGTPICDYCANSIAIQQVNWLVGTQMVRKYEEKKPKKK